MSLTNQTRTPVPPTLPRGGGGAPPLPRCLPFKLAVAPLPGRTLLPAASQGTGTKTISSARSGDRAAASQTPALPWPGQAPRVWAGGVTAESPPRAPPWWRCKVCHLSEGKRVTWGLPPETRPRAAAEGGRRCQLSLREWLSCCVAVSVLSEFCFFFNCDDWEVSPTHGLRGDRMLLRLRSAAGACYRCGLSGWTGKGATGQSKREART